MYSRFLWSGLIPLAIALEHAGYSRQGQPNILDADIASSAVKRKGTYVALTARKEDFSMHFEQEVLAAKQADPSGTDIKVILASDKASEGLDFKNI